MQTLFFLLFAALRLGKTRYIQNHFKVIPEV